MIDSSDFLRVFYSTKKPLNPLISLDSAVSLTAKNDD